MQLKNKYFEVYATIRMFRLTVRHLEFKAGFTSRRPITHYKLHIHNYGWHLVAWKLSVSYTNSDLITETVHKDCGGEVQFLGEDGISYCTECETIVEGQEEHLTLYEREQKYG